MVFLLNTILLLGVLSVAPRKPQNDLLAAFREKHPVEEEKVIPDKSPSQPGHSAVINTILSRLFPSRVTVSNIVRQL